MKRLALPLAFAIVAAAFLEGALLTRKSIPTSGRHVALAPAVSIRAPLPISGGGGGYRFPVRSELAAWAVKHTKGCGHLAGVERWKHNTVTLRLSKCRVTGTFSVRRYRATSTPRPTSIPTLPPPPTPVQPTPTVALSLPGPTPLPQTPSDYLLALLNQERTAIGVAALRFNSTQSAQALVHSQDMFATGSIWHQNPAYSSASFPAELVVPYRTGGENVGEASAGYGSIDAAILAVHQSMMAEQHDPAFCAVYDDHACNILNAAFTQVGIGVYIDSGGGTWLTEDFIG